MTRSLCLKFASLVVMTAMATATRAADAPAAAAAPQPDPSQTSIEALDDLDEIWIRGKRLSVVIEKAEDDFFKLYNKLSKNSQFDVYCGQMGLERGSMIMVRKCTPGFIVFNSYNPLSNTVSYGYGSSFCGGTGFMSSGDGYYGGYYASDYYSNWTSCGGGWSPPPVPPIPTELLLREKRPAYLKNVLAVVTGDQRLLDMIGRLRGLYDEMDLAQRHYVKVRGEPDRPARTPARSSRSSTSVVKPYRGPRAL